MPINFDSLLIKGLFQAPLSLSIQKEYNQLVTSVSKVPPQIHTKKLIPFSSATVSVSDLISYQIGWGTFLISWYETGLTGKNLEMPGHGFISWDYKGIAHHFYTKYQYDGPLEQTKAFNAIVTRILEITEKEYLSGNLDKLGVWPWCTLQSGKQWPLSKWIQVNTVAPYKRACGLIKKFDK